jgi:hypothetical protein
MNLPRIRLEISPPKASNCQTIEEDEKLKDQILMDIAKERGISIIKGFSYVVELSPYYFCWMGALLFALYGALWLSRYP